MKIPNLIRTSLLRSLVAPAAMALAAMGLASTAQAEDSKLLAVEFGPGGQNLQGSPWQPFTADTMPASKVFDSYTVSVTGSGFRNRGIPSPAVDAAWAKVVADNFYGGFTLKITGLSPGAQYYVNVYNARETNNNSRNVHFKMSTTGTVSDPSATDIGWSHQHKTLPAGWVPVANTGIGSTQYGEGWLKTPVFTATAAGAIIIYTD